MRSTVDEEDFLIESTRFEPIVNLHAETAFECLFVPGNSQRRAVLILQPDSVLSGRVVHKNEDP